MDIDDMHMEWGDKTVTDWGIFPLVKRVFVQKHRTPVFKLNSYLNDIAKSQSTFALLLQAKQDPD